MQPEQQEPQDISAVLREAGVATRPGDGTLFGESVLVIDQSPTDDRPGYQYEFFTGGGTAVANCATQPIVADASGSFTQIMEESGTEQILFYDHNGQRWAGASHRKVWKSRIIVTGADGAELGRIQQRNVLGRVRLDVLLAGQKAGRIRSTGTRLKEFTITGRSGESLGRIVKLGRYASWQLGREAKAVGRYVLELTAPLPQPLATVITVAPVVIDLAFSPDQAGYRATLR